MTTASRSTAWSPLVFTAFRWLWIASIVSNVGTWMHEVGAGWLMTSLSSSPSMVALVEAADSLPVMLLALPAGAIADIVDRRRLLIAVNVYFLIVIGALAMLTALGTVTAMHNFGAGDLSEVRPAAGRDTVMLPFTQSVVPLVDVAGGRIVVAPPEGAFEAARDDEGR